MKLCLPNDKNNKIKPKLKGRQAMKYIVSAFIWIVGFLSLLFVLLTIILMTYIIPKHYDRPGKALLRWLFWVVGARVMVEGKENIKPDQAYLLMANHVSAFDIPLIGGYFPYYFRGIQAAEQFKWPLFGWFLKRIGNIPIQRESAHASMRSLERAAQWVQQGNSLLILPEGTRTRDGKLRPFKRLPFRLAKMAKVPILPIGTSGLYRLKARKSFLIQPGPVKIKFGKPIPAEIVENLELDELRDLLQKRIAALVEFS